MFRRITLYVLLAVVGCVSLGCSGGGKANTDDKKQIDEINKSGVNPNPSGKSGGGVETP